MEEPTQTMDIEGVHVQWYLIVGPIGILVINMYG